MQLMSQRLRRNMSQAKVNDVVELNYAYNAFGKQVGRHIAGRRPCHCMTRPVIGSVTTSFSAEAGSYSNW